MVGKGNHVCQFPEDISRKEVIEMLDRYNLPAFTLLQESLDVLVVELLPKVVDSIQTIRFHRAVDKSAN
jgi:hypothetical protein